VPALKQRIVTDQLRVILFSLGFFCDSAMFIWACVRSAPFCPIGSSSRGFGNTVSISRFSFSNCLRTESERFSALTLSSPHSCCGVLFCLRGGASGYDTFGCQSLPVLSLVCRSASRFSFTCGKLRLDATQTVSGIGSSSALSIMSSALSCFTGCFPCHNRRRCVPGRWYRWVA
jgi:hypothetical protein